MAIGLAAALVVGRWIASRLFGVAPWDPWSLSAVTLLVASIAAAASYLPARQAARVDPMKALRSE